MKLLSDESNLCSIPPTNIYAVWQWPSKFSGTRFPPALPDPTFTGNTKDSTWGVLHGKHFMVLHYDIAFPHCVLNT